MRKTSTPGGRKRGGLPTCRCALGQLDGSHARDLKDILNCVRSQHGWRVLPTRGNHWKLLAPDGVTSIISSSTPSDFRAIKKLRSDLHRSGLDC